MRAVLVILAIVLIICFLAFVVYNAGERVEIHKQPFAKGTYHDVALAEVVFWSLVAGVLLAMLLFMVIYVRQSMHLRASRKRIRALESEVTILRNRPIEESAGLLEGADHKPVDYSSHFGDERK